MGIEWSKSKKERRIEGQIIKDTILEAVTRLEAKEPYSHLMELQKGLPWPFMEIYTQVMKESINSGGAVVISANAEKYLEYLGQFLNIVSDYFQATVRGGKLNPKYKLSWFNKKDTEEETPPAGMTKEEKLRYLDLVDNSKIKNKIRILVFDKDDRDEISDFLDEEIRKNYFEHNKSIECYLISPKDLIDLLKTKDIDEQKSHFIFEDYAIFDKEVVLKHNGIHNLSVSIKNQISWYKAVFEILEEHEDRFLKVDKFHIGDIKWEDFKNKRKPIKSHKR